jgi:hypothetical protein
MILLFKILINIDIMPKHLLCHFNSLVEMNLPSKSNLINYIKSEFHV